jgi:RNA polymerase sigma factor (sigma-70 family)
MSRLPETRESFLLKLRDRDDAAAWERLVAVYRPAAYRLARGCGLQHADAEDVAQQVIAAVSRSIGQWKKDDNRGTFRGWLLRIARNEAINVLTRGSRHAGRGGSSVVERLGQFADRDERLGRLIDDEHRRAVFRWAAQEVRPEFHDATWRAFWRTTIDGLSVEHAAAELGKSIGAVYAARSRVMRRLKEKVHEFDRG